MSSSKRRLPVLAVLGGLVGCSAGSPAFVDIATLERPSSPNSYLVCPAERTSAVVDREPGVFPMSAAALWERWSGVLATEPRLSEIAREETAKRVLVVQRTPIVRFPDVIQLEIYEASPEGSTLCLYSRSVYGYSDFGTNRARVEGWLTRLP